MGTLFTDDFPSIESQEELEKLISEYPDYDPYYVSSGAIKERRALFDELYEKYQPYADSHFLSEVKRQFHQRTWEMYLGVTLIENEVPISSEDHGPDFLIEENGQKFWIECIACTKGKEDNPDQVPVMIYEEVHSVPEEEMCIRIAGALEEKYKKYKKYLDSGTVAHGDVFIIAINSGDLEYPDPQIPLVLKCLFALGFQTISAPYSSERKTGWSRREFIQRKNGSPVPMNFFLIPEHSGISGVLYSRKNILNHPDPIGKDIIAISNPTALNPYPYKDLSFLEGYYFNRDDPNWSLEPTKGSL